MTNDRAWESSSILFQPLPLQARWIKGSRISGAHHPTLDLILELKSLVKWRKKIDDINFGQNSNQMQLSTFLVTPPYPGVSLFNQNQ